MTILNAEVFVWNFVVGSFVKICPQIPVLIKIGQN